MIYARRCSITGEGMNHGWVFGDGEMYAKEEKDAIEVAKQYGFESFDEAFEEEIVYFTEWDPLSEDTWYTENGTEIETRNFTLILGDISFFDPDIDGEYKAIIHEIRGIHVFNKEDTAEEVGEAVIEYTKDGYLILNSYSGDIFYKGEKLKNL